MLEGYCEKHHVIPKCIAPELIKDKSNIVKLTAREHFVCHLLLCEIYSNNGKLKLGLWMMVNAKSRNQERDFNFSSRLYEKLKIEMSNLISKINTGRSTWNKGKKATADHLQNMSKGHKGLKQSPESIAKRTAKNKGKKRNDESRQRMRVAWESRPPTSSETRRKMSNTRKGIPPCRLAIEKSAENHRHSVIQHDMEGNSIKRWVSVIEAESILNINNISACCRGKQKSAGGFQWKYEEDDKVITKYIKPYKGKNIIQLDMQNNFIKEWKSAKEAQLFLGIDQNIIGKCCKGLREAAGGFKWKYK